jgi:hypothetical protein
MNYPYHHTQQLCYKHLGKGELFMFPPGEFTPAIGPYMKLSPRKYIRVDAWIRGERIRHVIQANAPILKVNTINAPVTSRVSDYLLPTSLPLNETIPF